MERIPLFKTNQKRLNHSQQFLETQWRVRLFCVQRIVPAVVVVLALGSQLQAGRTLKILGAGFSFLITEPEGWTIDIRSAAQIANLVMYKTGTTWREADVVVFARFIERAKKETLTDFVQLDINQFKENCPSSEIKDLNLKAVKHEKFLTKAYNCQGGRNKIVAFTKLPKSFGVFVLSSKNDRAVSDALLPFEQMLSSFQWLGETEGRAPAGRKGDQR